jgi:hypothetical protein
MTLTLVPLRPLTQAERARKYRSRKRKRHRKTVTRHVTKSVTREPVNLVQLRRDIADWIALHHKVTLLKKQQPHDERRMRVSDQVCRVTCLTIGVGFFALIAVAALN